MSDLLCSSWRFDIYCGRVGCPGMQMFTPLQSNRSGSPGGPAQLSSTDGKAVHPIVASGPTFLTIPCEIRLIIYEMVLAPRQTFLPYQSTDSRIIVFAPHRPIWLDLLYTNREIYFEASDVLYRTNGFNFVHMTQNQFSLLQAFLFSVGRLNAGSISRLCISFPSFGSAAHQPGCTILKDADLQSFKLLQEKCIKLSTLEFFLYHHNATCLKADPLFKEYWMKSISS